MVVVPDGVRCAVCGDSDAVVLCDECSKPLCTNCRTFDMWGYGCGHVDTKAFCRTCYNSIEINPYGGGSSGEK
ncbi:MAG: hypothetical protein JW884_02740 [Deltaproteobacteria bacterium]|nr:hypothetical protein [Deltaproteobacteria bacterium]